MGFSRGHAILSFHGTSKKVVSSSHVRHGHQRCCAGALAAGATAALTGTASGVERPQRLGWNELRLGERSRSEPRAQNPGK